MSVTVKKSVLKNLDHEVFAKACTSHSYLKNEDAPIDLDFFKLPDAAREELRAYANRNNDRSLLRVLKAYDQMEEGNTATKVPTLKSFADILMAHLRHSMIDGWLYAVNKDGTTQPELVLDAIYTDGRHQGDNPAVIVSTIYIGQNSNGKGKDVAPRKNAITFSGADVVNKTISEILTNFGYYKETLELKASYIQKLSRHVDEIMTAFAKQHLFTGEAKIDYKTQTISRRKVIVDLEQDDYSALNQFEESKLSKGEPLPIPYHTCVRVFDLKTYDFYWVNSQCLTAYKYDKALATKLVLPTTHRDLLDVLTSDLASFTGDIIEGKSTGNVILCAGAPGIGKTLTAEVYSETLQVPLYSVHSGNLGTNAESVQKRLQVIFERAQRWGCAILLDEADVFVKERGESLELNAICAEFLRALEYYEGLIFLTTNRQDTIDDAILSRCIAIIRYERPATEDAAKIWKIISSQLGNTLDDNLISNLTSLFRHASGRDIKMLCGSVFRMNKAGRWDVDVESFRRAAMFRGVEMNRDANRGDGLGVEDDALNSMVKGIQDELEAKLGFRPSGADAMKYLIKQHATG